MYWIYSVFVNRKQNSDPSIMFPSALYYSKSSCYEPLNIYNPLLD